MVKLIDSNTAIRKEEKHNTGIIGRYNAYCKGQENQGIVWYLIPLMTLPAAIMPISMIAMSFFPGYIAFIGISILLYFTNIILTLAEQPTKYKITFYLITVLYHVAVPLISFLVWSFAG